MADERAPDPQPRRQQPEPEVPRPPSAEELAEISRQQALITDEWVGEADDGRKPGEPQPDDSGSS